MYIFTQPMPCHDYLVADYIHYLFFICYVELNQDMTKENNLLMSIRPADVCRLSYFRLYYLSIKLENLVDIALSESEQLKKVWHPNFPSWPDQIVKNVLENGLGTKAYLLEKDQKNFLGEDDCGSHQGSAAAGRRDQDRD